MNNKKGSSDLQEQVIFIILNITFALMLIFFVARASTGAYVNEQYYSKQIGLLIDSAKPGSLISLDVTDAYNLAKKNKVSTENMVKFEGNNVIVSLSNSRKYSFQYFSDVSIEKSYRIENKDARDEKVFLDISLIANGVENAE